MVKAVTQSFNEYREDFLVQDWVRQYKGMAAMNPTSVNTLRIMSYRSGMDVYAAIRIGRKGQAIDNESAGGIGSKINVDGTLCRYA